MVSKISENIRHKWTEEEKKYLGEITPGRHRKEITDLMNEKFEYKFRTQQIVGAIKRYGYDTGFNGRFQKGHEPWNKDTKGIAKSNRTSFQKGHEPWNKKKVGDETVDIHGYTKVKVGEPNVWELKQRIMYEKYHNIKLTQDDVVIFADQNKLNFEKDNLILVSKKQLLEMNRNKLIFQDKELTKTGANIAELMMKINERKNKNGI